MLYDRSEVLLLNGTVVSDVIPRLPDFARFWSSQSNFLFILWGLGNLLTELGNKIVFTKSFFDFECFWQLFWCLALPFLHQARCFPFYDIYLDFIRILLFLATAVSVLSQFVSHRVLLIFLYCSFIHLSCWMLQFNLFFFDLSQFVSHSFAYLSLLLIHLLVLLGWTLLLFLLSFLSFRYHFFISCFFTLFSLKQLRTKIAPDMHSGDSRPTGVKPSFSQNRKVLFQFFSALTGLRKTYTTCIW